MGATAQIKVFKVLKVIVDHKNMNSTKQFKKDETVECKYCSFWLLRKTLPSHLRKHHMDRFAGPDPENCLDFSELTSTSFAGKEDLIAIFMLKEL